MTGENFFMLRRLLVRLPLGHIRAEEMLVRVPRAEHAANTSHALGIVEDLEDQGVARPQPVQLLLRGRHSAAMIGEQV